jgi:hypothetical protein
MQKFLKHAGPMPYGPCTDSTGFLDPKQQSDHIYRWAENMALAVCDRSPGGISWLVRKLKRELEGAVYNRGLDNWLSGIALMDEFVLLWSWRQTIDHCDPLTVRKEMRSRDMLPHTFEFVDKRTIDVLRDGTGDLESSKLLRRFCEVPLPKGPKDMLWLNKMTTARESLTEFWTRVRYHLNERQRKIGRAEEFRAAILSHMSFDISPAHLSRMSEERRQIEEEDQKPRAPGYCQENDTLFVHQSWDIGMGSDSVVKRSVTKKVKKTRQGTSDKIGLEKLTLSNDPAANHSDGTDLASAPVARIAVKQDSVSVISKMFPTGADGSGGVRWTQLVQALTDAGMGATQVGGSEVSFAHPCGSIKLHRPHLDPTVDAVRLR